MKHFFLVADWGAHHYLRVPNIMLSAGSISTPDGKKWNRSRTRLPEGVERVILDSGGYAFFSRWGEYPFTIEKYIELAHYIKDTHPLYKAAILDYPCEPDINRSQVMSNEDRIEKTIANAIECYDTDDSLPWLPVIQGYTVSEYLHCIDLYDDYGVTSDYWAIGSICSRKGAPFELRNIITKIKERHPNDKLHAFGLGIPFLRNPQIFQAIYSSDSAAWNWGISGENMRSRKKEAAIAYVAQIDDMIETYADQTQLKEFIN